MKSEKWKTYRTRFLVQAKQLSSTLTFVDPLGRQHCGRKGDYLVESSDGVLSIAPRRIFEDIYVPMSRLENPETSSKKAPLSAPTSDHRRVEALEIQEVRLPARRLAPPAASQRDDSPIVTPGESSRGGRKLPQPCHIRPSSTGFSVM